MIVKSRGRGDRETAGDDFPFYNGRPVRISGAQWSFVLVMVAIGFAAIATPIPFLRDGVMQIIPAIAFLAIPLAGLAIVAPRDWTAIFRKVGAKDLLWMLAIGALNIVVSIVAGWVVLKLFGAASNPVFSGLAQQGNADRALFFIRTIPQLLGEEVLTILPFLALAWFFYEKMHTSRALSIGLAWQLSAVLFGLAHLPTYDWNLVQCLIVIGSARLVLTLAYLKTKNIWVSFGAHVINDWTLFGIGLVGTVAAGS